IKTIGDCIQIAGGVPDQLETEEMVVLYAEKVCLMSLLMIKFLETVSKNISRKLQLRIGVHSDIWSQDVDVASLMEQTGQPGSVHISATVYSLLKDHPLFKFIQSSPVTAFNTTIPTFEISTTETLTELSLQEIRHLHKTNTNKSIPLITPKSTLATGIQRKGSNFSGFLEISPSLTPITASSSKSVKHSSTSSPSVTKPEKSNKIKSHHAKLATYQSRFQKESSYYTRMFLDRTKEEAYRIDFMLHYAGTLTVTASIIIFAFWSLFLAHCLIHFLDISEQPGTFRLVGQFAAYVILGILMSLFVVRFHAVNNGLRVRYIGIVDKGETADTALWLTDEDESENVTENVRIGLQKLKWLRPNGFAILTLGTMTLATALGILPLGRIASVVNNPDGFTIGFSAPLDYVTSGFIITIQLHALYIGVRVHRINIGLVFVVCCTVVFYFSTMLIPVNSVMNDGDSGLWSLSSAMLFVNVVNFVTLSVIYVSVNRMMDSLARLSYFMKRENEISFAQTRMTQHGSERLLRNILPLTVVQRMRENQKLAGFNNALGMQIADDKDEVSIFFCSISNFLPFEAESQKAAIALLNEIICDFDECCAAFGVEKIKTI
ncbi:hypothetical protein HK096_007222, partial [Nowakowskiella sp. JEL0078]